jgi:hypothetical protein
MYSHLLFAIILVGHDAMNFGSNSTVRHESFSTASRVGVVAAIDGWMRAEYAILGTYRGRGEGLAEVMVVVDVCGHNITDF